LSTEKISGKVLSGSFGMEITAAGTVTDSHRIPFLSYIQELKMRYQNRYKFTANFSNGKTKKALCFSTLYFCLK